MGRIEQPRREAWLDGLKGFGCLLVILGHVLSGYLDAGTFPGYYGPLYSLRTWIYSFHMPLFFLLSGFTFTLAYFREGKLRRGHFLRQLLDLIWVYTVFALLQWGIKQLVPGLVNEAYSLDDLKGMFATPLGNFWYVYILCLMYIIVAAVHMPRRSPLWLIPLAGLSIYAASADLAWTDLTVYRLLYHLCFFFLGGVLCTRRGLLRSEKLMGLSAMVLATAAYFYFCWYTRNWYAGWKFLIAAATGCVFLWEFVRWEKLSGLRVFQLFGKYALEIYLLHTFFTGGLRTLLPMLGVTTPAASVLVNFILSAGISLGLSVLLGRFRAADLLFRPARLFRR